MNLLIREATLNDAEYITGLSGQLGYETTIEKTYNRLTKLLVSNDHCVYVVSLDEAIVGWIHGFYAVTVESEPCVEIGGLVIDEDQRRRGIGRLLVDKLLAWAYTKEVSRVRVRSNTIRKYTHLFYLGIGFTEIKEQKVFDKPLR